MAPKRVHLSLSEKNARRVWRYQRGNQNPYIEEKQITQWPEEKVQKDKQRSTKHTYKTKDRVTRTPLKTGGELRCSGRVSSSCSTSGTRRVNLVTTAALQKAGLKGRTIARATGHPQSTIYGVLKCFKQRGTVENKERSGRPIFVDTPGHSKTLWGCKIWPKMSTPGSY